MNIMLLKTAVALAGALIMSAGPALARDHGVCTNYSLRGSFGYVSWGTLLASYAGPDAGPFGEIGRQTFDGSGHTAAVVTFSANGDVGQNISFNGTYKVNLDCTGSWTLSNPVFGPVHADFVIDHNGMEIRAISTDAGVIETRVYRKQFEDDQ
ncbi:MAG: hypothetical protein OJF55_001321 [Rhodanobacteraceae bacterium]|nr:MAG: hypothetical protein OJF55_001321 [Rhodanobacteraceae bacterium]